MKKIFATVMLFITALCFSGRASATLELEITGGQDIGYPIAVSDFAAAANPQLARDLAAVVRTVDDFIHSGFSPARGPWWMLNKKPQYNRRNKRWAIRPTSIFLLFRIYIIMHFN